MNIPAHLSQQDSQFGFLQGLLGSATGNGIVWSDGPPANHSILHGGFPLWHRGCGQSAPKQRTRKKKYCAGKAQTWCFTPNFLKILVECRLFLPQFVILFLTPLEKDQQTRSLFLEFCRMDLCIPTWTVVNLVDVHFHYKFNIGTKFLLANGTGSLVNC